MPINTITTFYNFTIFFLQFWVVIQHHCFKSVVKSAIMDKTIWGIGIYC